MDVLGDSVERLEHVSIAKRLQHRQRATLTHSSSRENGKEIGRVGHVPKSTQELKWNASHLTT